MSAAEAYFGSWGKALYAAGIDPNLYFFASKVAQAEHKQLRCTRSKVHTVMIDDAAAIEDGSFDGFGYVQGFQVIPCGIAQGD